MSDFIYPGSRSPSSQVILARNSIEADKVTSKLLENSDSDFSILDGPSTGLMPTNDSDTVCCSTTSLSNDFTGRDIDIVKCLEKADKYFEDPEISVIYELPAHAVRLGEATGKQVKDYLDAQVQRAQENGLNDFYIGIDPDLERFAEDSDYNIEVRYADSIL
jgi:hypothetical protein